MSLNFLRTFRKIHKDISVWAVANCTVSTRYLWFKLKRRHNWCNWWSHQSKPMQTIAAHRIAWYPSNWFQRTRSDQFKADGESLKGDEVKRIMQILASELCRNLNLKPSNGIRIGRWDSQELLNEMKRSLRISEIFWLGQFTAWNSGLGRRRRVLSENFYWNFLENNFRENSARNPQTILHFNNHHLTMRFNS